MEGKSGKKGQRRRRRSSSGSSVDEMDFFDDASRRPYKKYNDATYSLVQSDIFSLKEVVRLQKALKEKTDQLAAFVKQAKDAKSEEKLDKMLDEFEERQYVEESYTIRRAVNNLIRYASYQMVPNGKGAYMIHGLSDKLLRLMIRRLDILYKELLLPKRTFQIATNRGVHYVIDILNHIEFLKDILEDSLLMENMPDLEETKMVLGFQEAICHHNINRIRKAKEVLDAAILPYKKASQDEHDKDVDLYPHVEKLLDVLSNKYKRLLAEEKKRGVHEPTEDLHPRKPKKGYSFCHFVNYQTATAEKGSGMLAKRKIRPGQIVFEEVAGFSCNTAYDITTEHGLSSCFQCTKRTWLLLPCPYCPWVMFCSHDCLFQGHVNSESECPLVFVPYLMKILGMKEFFKFESKTFLELVALVFQMISRIPFNIWKRKKTAKKTESPVIDNVDLMEDIVEHWINLNIKVDQRMFKKYTEYAVYIVYLLRMTRFFGKDGKMPRVSPAAPAVRKTDEDDLMMVHVAFKLLACVSSFHLPIKEKISRGGALGTPFDPRICNFNVIRGRVLLPLIAKAVHHDCDPNAVLVCDGKTAKIYSTRLIREGESVTISYGVDALRHPLKLRQYFHRQRFGRDCSCMACKTDLKLSRSANGVIYQEKYKKGTELIIPADYLRPNLVFKTCIENGAELQLIGSFAKGQFLTALMSQARSMAYFTRYQHLEGNDSVFPILCQILEAINTFFLRPIRYEIILNRMLIHLIETNFLAADSFITEMYHVDDDIYHPSSLLTTMVIEPCVVQRFPILSVDKEKASSDEVWRTFQYDLHSQLQTSLEIRQRLAEGKSKPGDEQLRRKSDIAYQNVCFYVFDVRKTVYTDTNKRIKLPKRPKTAKTSSIKQNMKR